MSGLISSDICTHPETTKRVCTSVTPPSRPFLTTRTSPGNRGPAFRAGFVSSGVLSERSCRACTLFSLASFTRHEAEIRRVAACLDLGPFDPSCPPLLGGPRLLARHLLLGSPVFEVFGHYESCCCEYSRLGLFLHVF